MKREITTLKVNSSYAVVGAQEDIDGAEWRVTLNPNRSIEGEQTVLFMDPATARALARRLNRWAKLIDPPQKRGA